MGHDQRAVLTAHQGRPARRLLAKLDRFSDEQIIGFERTYHRVERRCGDRPGVCDRHRRIMIARFSEVRVRRDDAEVKGGPGSSAFLG